MGQNEDVWVEVECRNSEFQIRCYRGLGIRDEIQRLIRGEEIAFLTLSECYWYNSPESDSEFGTTLGAFERLGYDEYANFSGEMHIRCSTIVNLAYLHGGFESEPRHD